ncbi:MAG: aryl-alcohol dehydrogenase-like predicted oxidoreductase [Candidatus Azotimanducaceae bacterium]|jgi:aryl-alcohol dehydrogenase-like predicted oxidoreductase
MDSLSDLLSLAEELGINYLDTAPAYGDSESRLGELLKKNRAQWIISTKVGEYYEGTQSRYDFSAQATLASVELSLKRLGTDYLDIVFVHSNGEDKDVIQSSPTLESLAQLKQRGLIRAIGYSGKDPVGSALAMEIVDVFMISLNETDTSHAALLATCQQQEKGVVIKKALSSGHANDPGAALRFAADYPGVSSVIVGTIDPKHLASNVEAIITR